ncbi:MAG TPA: hypothetical protein PK771_04355, partial [Spirochaetota bacterium]|nr:hypothetical protein [Spirochaetota bacterium]
MEKEDLNFRLKLLMIVFIVIPVVLIIRILYLISVDMDDYSIIGENEISQKRGNIYDRNNHILAISDDLNSIYANPNEIKDKKALSIYLSKILNINKNDLEKKLLSKKNFVWIKRQITPLQVDTIKKEKIAGLYFKNEYKRFYPNKNLASHIIGFCNID